MKRRISDMLNNYCESNIEMEYSAPLSSERIKELTMSKIENKQEKKGKRMAFRLLVIAAAISLITMTAFAAEEYFNVGEIIRGMFREDFSDSQAEVVNQLGGDFQPETQTSEGTTVTLAAAYGDAYTLHLYLQVEAPEDTVLPDGILYDFCDWNAIDFSAKDHWENLKPGENAPYDTISRSMDIEPLADDDPTDNKKDFHVTISGQPGTDCKFNDGYSKFFNMTGIYQQVLDVDGDEDGYVQLAPGNFSFDVGIVNEVESIQLDVDGLTYGGHKTRSWTHDSPCSPLCDEELTGETDPETGLPIHAEEWDYEVTVRSMTISNLSAEWEIGYTTDDENKSFDLSFHVVLKDGTVVKNRGGGLGGEYGDNRSSAVTYFEEPIDLNEVDYILIGDPEINSTHKVYLP